MIANAAYYLKKGVLRAPLHFQFCMGCANGIPGTMKNLAFMKETMESLCPNSTWSCFGVGHCAMEMLLRHRCHGRPCPGGDGGQCTL
ncbi:MAG: 3-keto-5-aminohexanoate cleavage protein [Enterocloster clostridioformis]